jgi:hypothetical protein
MDASAAQRNDIVSLHNWVTGTGRINLDEAAFLYHQNDIMTIVSRPDETQSWLETCLVRIWMKIGRTCFPVSLCPEFVASFQATQPVLICIEPTALFGAF